MELETISIALFPVLFGMVLVWFVLVKLLFNRLEQAHPQTYEAMGRPSLFLRNSPAGVIAMLKFLVRREHRALSDGGLSKLSDAMLVFLAVYLVLFI
ncbi:hypothetical protein, partial [Lysobacter sp. A3-1-A15]